MKRIVICLVLAGCAATSPAPAPVVENPLPVGLDDTCGAAPHAALVGQDATALERVLILGQIRITHPGTIVTQDYRPERINFHIGADERIAQISCG